MKRTTVVPKASYHLHSVSDIMPILVNKRKNDTRTNCLLVVNVLSAEFINLAVINISGWGRRCREWCRKRRWYNFLT